MGSEGNFYGFGWWEVKMLYVWVMGVTLVILSLFLVFRQNSQRLNCVPATVQLSHAARPWATSFDINQWAQEQEINYGCDKHASRSPANFHGPASPDWPELDRSRPRTRQPTLPSPPANLLLLLVREKHEVRLRLANGHQVLVDLLGRCRTLRHRCRAWTEADGRPGKAVRPEEAADCLEREFGSFQHNWRSED